MDDNWSEQTPPLLSRSQTSKLERLSNCVRIVWTKLQGLPLLGKGVCWLTLLVLALLLAACGTPSMPASEKPRIPSPPPTHLSDSPPNYSKRAASDIQMWRQKLTEPTQKPGN